MQSRKLTLAIGSLLLAATAGILHSQVSPAGPIIDPQAETVLRQLSEHNKQVTSAVFRITDTIDDVQADGRKIQFAHLRTLTVARPDKLKVEMSGDVTNKTLWKDGKTLTLLDRDNNVYAQIPDPGSIEQAVDLLQDQYGVSIPASDLLSGDLYKTMTDGCQTVDYVGLGYVGAEKCHHLAFTRENIDWQLWVATGDIPAARKLLITYKLLPGEPQYTLQLLDAELAPTIDPAVFTPALPDGAEKIDFQPARSPK